MTDLAKELAVDLAKKLAAEDYSMYTEINEDGVTVLSSDKLIFVVKTGQNLYQFFIGDKPKQNEEGKWITKNPNALTFILKEGLMKRGFSCSEPTEITFVSTQKYQEEKKANYLRIKDLEAQLRTIHFKDYWKCKRERIRYFCYSHLPSIHYCNGNVKKMIRFSVCRDIFSIEYVWRKDKSEKHFCLSTHDWNRFLTIKENGKWCWEYKKHVNSGDCCAL